MSTSPAATVLTKSDELQGPKCQSAMDVTDATFETDVLERSTQTTVVVDLWASWCGPCRVLGPILEKVVGETPDVELVKVDVDANPRTAATFQVQSIPGRVRHPGPQGRRQLRRVPCPSRPCASGSLAWHAVPDRGGPSDRRRRRSSRCGGRWSSSPANERAVLALAGSLVDNRL